MDNEAPDRSSAKVDAADEAEHLLKKIAEARDQALRMKLALTARLLDMACLELTSSGNRK